MHNAAQENRAKKIKKNVYGKPQTIQAVFPSGMGETALNEIRFILNHLWLKQKYTSEFTLIKNIIRIEPIHLFAAIELLIRSQSLADIRLIIFEGHASGKDMFKKKCLDIPWHFYLDKKMSLKIKVNSVASRAFHESGLKNILGHILEDHIDEIVSGENTHETTCLYVDLYKNKLTVSLSLAGEPLYKRGYREMLSRSAPLREDAAFCCLNRALTFAKKMDNHFVPDIVFIPFSGTGTFAFEYLLNYLNFSPVLFLRNYAFTRMPFFKPEHFNFLLKKAEENILPWDEKIHFICMDYSNAAMAVFLENLNNIKNAFEKNHCIFSENILMQYENDFFKIDLNTLLENKNVFMPLNPPYGIRMAGNKNSIDLYKKIAERINEISEITQKSGKKLSGFILCPDENTWTQFCKMIKNMKTETYHFMQGGLDIRVCLFYKD